MNGKPLPPLAKAPITREQLKLYAKAAQDPNPIHQDDEAAKKAGLPSVIAHGMLTMAFMGEFLHQALASLGGGRLTDMSCRFKAMVFPGDQITVNGVVKTSEGNVLRCDLEARNQKGEVTATGHATLSLLNN